MKHASIPDRDKEIFLLCTASRPALGGFSQGDKAAGA
jgi:hypothetical protein